MQNCKLKLVRVLLCQNKDKEMDVVFEGEVADISKVAV